MKFIGLDNYENINCYFITVLQILHSSETLTKHLLNGDLDKVRQTLKTTMEPLFVYAEMKGTDDELRENIKKCMHIKPPLIRDGYNWLSLLNIYYFPVFYILLGREVFYTILQEMSIEQHMIYSDIRMENFEMIPEDERAVLRPYLDEYKKNIRDIILNYRPTRFEWKITALEMYINTKYGHVAPVLHENGVLYIFDDHCVETLYDHFIEFRRTLSDKLRLYYFNKDLVKLYNDNLHVDKHSVGFVENNFSHVFRNFNTFTATGHVAPETVIINTVPNCSADDSYKWLAIVFGLMACILAVIIGYCSLTNKTPSQMFSFGYCSGKYLENGVFRPF